MLALRQGPAHAHRVQLDAAQLGRGALSGRVHPQSRDQNRRDIGQSQSTRTASKMETPAAHDDEDDVLAAELPLPAQGPPPPPMGRRALGCPPAPLWFHRRGRG